MFKKVCLLSTAALSIAISITGCTLTDQPPTCEQMQRQMVYNATNLNGEASWTTSSQHEALKQQIDNNCT